MKKSPPSKGKKRIARSTAGGKFVLGSARFEKISKLEGLTLTRDMKGRIEKFDREKTPAAERRRTIIRAYRKG